jgi:hypothetical protein
MLEGYDILTGLLVAAVVVVWLAGSFISSRP